jgi:hypothetical protein
MAGRMADDAFREQQWKHRAPRPEGARARRQSASHGNSDAGGIATRARQAAVATAFPALLRHGRCSGRVAVRPESATLFLEPHA